MKLGWSVLVELGRFISNTIRRPSPSCFFFPPRAAQNHTKSHPLHFFFFAAFILKNIRRDSSEPIREESLDDDIDSENLQTLVEAFQLMRALRRRALCVHEAAGRVNVDADNRVCVCVCARTDSCVPIESSILEHFAFFSTASWRSWTRLVSGNKETSCSCFSHSKLVSYNKINNVSRVVSQDYRAEVTPFI